MSIPTGGSTAGPEASPTAQQADGASDSEVAIIR